MKTLLNKLRRWMLWLALSLLGLVVLAGVLFWRATIAPPPPAFYTPPDPLPAGAPGALIRSEPITDPLPEGAVAWRVLYLSTGLKGEPIAVSGVVVAPAGHSTSPRPVIAWAHGTIGILPECGVSHTKNPYQQTPALDLMVREGFIVAATDYPGLGTPGLHPYLVGPVEAYAVLDSVRAAHQLDLNAGDRFAVWGASQGGQASLWTAQTAAEYAPELTLIAAAASAPATDLAEIIRSKLNDVGGGVFISETLYAWSQVYPGANLDEIIKSEQRAQFEKMATTCISTPKAFLLIGGLLKPSDYLSVDILTTEPWRTLLADNSPRGQIKVPLLISHGTADTLIPLELSEAEAARRCAEGEDVQFVRLPGVAHDARDESGILTIGWIEDRFAGRPTGSTCGY